MNLLTELKQRHFCILSTAATVHCTAFEDNNGALKIANVPKMRPRTKHINLVYDYFRSHVGKDIFIRPIDTGLQIADIFTNVTLWSFLSSSPETTVLLGPITYEKEGVWDYLSHNNRRYFWSDVIFVGAFWPFDLNLWHHSLIPTDTSWSCFVHF